jgi:predicted 3-demethylubiquinone-9 3-methyltransferase (glyoxalase superfamily)
LKELLMSKISPCLWFDGEAEQAANFYVSLLPDSRIEKVQKNTLDSPAGKAGSVLVVEFTLAGQRFMALNGGTRFEYTHAVSFKIDCADQAEVDRLWAGLCANGGQAERCGWLKDRYGVFWQIVPTALPQYLGGPDRAGAQRAMQAMLQMTKFDIAGLKNAYEGKSAA